jgi:hypothetical protein
MAATATETYEFGVSEAPTLDLRNKAGNVTVTPGPDGQVRVVVTKRVRGGILGGGSEVDLERVRVEARQSGNTIIVDAKRLESWKLTKQYTIEFEITTPATTDVKLTLNAGNTRLAGITGVVQGTVNAGNLETEGVTLADGSRFVVNAGNLTLRGGLLPGASLDAEVNAGNARLTLPANTPVNLDARTTAGSIQVSGGQITVMRHFASQSASGALGPDPQGRLRVKVDAGNITVHAE